MILIEILSCILMVLSVYFFERKNRIAWILGIGSNITAIIVLIPQSLFILVGLNVLLIIMSLRGYKKWEK